MSKTPIFTEKIHFFVVFWTLLSLLFPGLAFSLDTSKYIPLDEIKAGMEGYALTVYSGTRIEKFPVKVLSVAKDARPGKDAIFVMGLDERFIHTGPVQGCSGSPVYLDGRIAGALAFGWGLAKDPLYGVTPIEEMLRVGQDGETPTPGERLGPKINASTPVDLKFYYDSYIEKLQNFQHKSSNDNALAIPVVSDLSSQAAETINPLFKNMGMQVLGGVGNACVAGGDVMMIPNFEPGSVLALPLVEGDIRMAAIGTVTEVRGDEVFGFGHAMFGQGELNLPMATGYVHMVVANLSSSFKFGQAGQIVGALRADESTAVYGRIGEKAPMIPICVDVTRYNSDERKIYSCEIAEHEMLTPLLVQAVAVNALLMRGDMPMYHTLNYSIDIGIEGYENLSFSNMSSGSSIYDLTSDAVGPIVMLMSNAYKRPRITGIKISVDLDNEDRISAIWSAELNQTTFKPGDTVRASVVTEAMYSEKNVYNFQLAIPDDLMPGKYKLTITGEKEYSDLLKKAAPYKYRADNFDQLLTAIRNIATIKRNKLYCVLEMPGQGIAIDNSPLENLPATKALTLIDQRRSVDLKSIGKLITKKTDSKNIVFDSRTIEIDVEEK